MCNYLANKSLHMTTSSFRQANRLNNIFIKHFNAFRYLSKCWSSITRKFFFVVRTKEDLITLLLGNHGDSHYKKRYMVFPNGRNPFTSTLRSGVCRMAIMVLSFYIRCKRLSSSACYCISPYPSPFFITLSTDLNLLLDFDARLMNII